MKNNGFNYVICLGDRNWHRIHQYMQNSTNATNILRTLSKTRTYSIISRKKVCSRNNQQHNLWFINILVASDVISHYDTLYHKAILCIYYSYDITLVCDAIRNIHVVLGLFNYYINSMWRHCTRWYSDITSLDNS